MPVLSGNPLNLSEDVETAFTQAVKNNQVSMAMYYAAEKFDRLNTRIQELEEKLENMESDNNPVESKTPPVKKAAAKKSTAKKAEDKKENEDSE